jgi:hypothetical protein
MQDIDIYKKNSWLSSNGKNEIQNKW